MSYSDILDKPLFETSGPGDVTFAGYPPQGTQFKLRFLPNGIIVGELEFPHSFYAHFVEISFAREKSQFSFSGKGNLEDETSKISIEKGYLTGSHTSFDTEKGVTEVKASFTALRVILGDMTQEIASNSDMLLKFGILNAFETFNVTVDTELGVLTLTPFENIKQTQQLMETYGIPMITSVVQLLVKVSEKISLATLLERTERIVSDFLKITSLAQGTWHNYAFVEVFKKIQTEQYKRILTIILHPKVKMPREFGITSVPYSSNFISSAWKGYSKELNDLYGFDYALEWYTESHSASVVESKFLMATTCLELMMDRYHSQIGSEYLLKEKVFKEFQHSLKKYAKPWLKEKKVSPNVRNYLYQGLGGINRRQYVDKAQMLLDSLGVRFDDLGVSLQDIVDVRNDITHAGSVSSKTADTQEVILTYHGLKMLLARIFLAILKYDGQYYDWVRKDYLRFDDVCANPENIAWTKQESRKDSKLKLDRKLTGKRQVGGRSLQRTSTPH